MVKIVTDTTACLSAEVARQYDIRVIPQIVTFGERSYYEGIELDNTAFMEKLKTSSELPKTAAPPPELFRKEFERLAPLGAPILCIHPSSEVSGTVRSARIAAQEFPQLDIRVIDTRLIASPLATLVELAARWAEDGIDVAEIESRIMAMIPAARVYFLVATLEYLARGGRIGGAQALLGSVLQIKPILTLRDGKVQPYEKERTHKRAVARLKEIVQEQMRGNSQGYLAVMHAAALEEAQALADDLGRRFNLSRVPITEVPPAVITHGGPGILGVSFFV